MPLALTCSSQNLTKYNEDHDFVGFVASVKLQFLLSILSSVSIIEKVALADMSEACILVEFVTFLKMLGLKMPARSLMNKFSFSKQFNIGIP